MVLGQRVVRAPEKSGPVLMITPVLAVQHKLTLHNNSHDASLRALSVDKRCCVLTLSSRVFTPGRLRESGSRDGGISLRRVGPPVLSQSRSTYRYADSTPSGTGKRAAVAARCSCRTRGLAVTCDCLCVAMRRPAVKGFMEVISSARDP
jgi:hypothetical protein